jgi:AcrR family transcriptional regulator
VTARQETESRGYRSFLRQDAIIAEARRIAEVDGLAAVSMRSVAEALDCTPRALYRHVAGKDELLELLADDALGEIPLPSGDGDPHEAVIAFYLALREVLVASPAIVEIIAQLPVAGPHFRAHGEAVVARLVAAGLPPRDAVEAMIALGQFTIGASLPGTGQRLHEAYRALAGIDGGTALGRVRQHFVRDSAVAHFGSALRRLLGAYRPATSN